VRDELSVGVVGASGFTGRELCRLLLGHRRVGRILPAARSAEPFERRHRNLLGSGLQFVSAERLVEQARELDVVFFCTPAGEAMRLAGHFLDEGSAVIDLGADFRFPDPATYRAVYGVEHAAPHLLAQVVYGVPELARDAIRGARLVANPGCYVIAALLAVAPLIGDDGVDPGALVGIHAVNGTTGAGNTSRPELHHAAVANDMLPYSLEGHRHCPELELQLARLAGRTVRVDFNTAHGPFARGIYLQASVQLRRGDGVNRDVLLDRYKERYGAGHRGEHFVLVVDFPKTGGCNAKEYDVYPDMASVLGSNFCHLGVDYDAAHAVVRVVSVLDNLVKGAAGTAIQNMNLLFSFDESEGLRHYGL
jgi:N-acetyl-gamma-glutamyl-phosphate reductase common form